MKLSILMMINAVIAAVFGIAFILIPVQIFSFYGSVEPTPALIYMGQLFGVATVTIGILTWLQEMLKLLRLVKLLF